jgi:glycerophosphoryl diester phosphodiesterase
MKYFFAAVLLVFILFFSCSKNDITLPPYNPETNLENTIPISNSIMKNMEGIYKFAAGSGNLGEHFVCKTSNQRITFFSNQSGIFMILKYGLNPVDSSIQFAGFWRYSENTTQGKIGFYITKDKGGRELILNQNADSISLEGLFLDVDLYTKELTISFDRHFSQYIKTIENDGDINNDFAIYAHHGVQTTANPPYAENSIDGVLNDEAYGINGLEFDVRMTKDHVPICMHDPTINTRLTLKGPLSGAYDQYNFGVLSNYIRLRDGQKIPSVEQVLKAFISSTTLKFMWLDIKGNPDIFKYLDPIVRDAYAYAATLNRNVIIIADLPTKEVIDQYKAWPAYADLPTMCELELQDVTDNQCEYWGPRYSEGLLLDDVNRAHSLGIKVYSWTLNDKTIIRNYLENGKFDGFITDFPAYVVYDYYTMF